MNTYTARQPDGRLASYAAALIALSLLFATGCGPSATVTPVVTITPPASTTVLPGASANVTATVTHNASGVIWTLSGSCTGAACGTLTNVTPTSVTYVAPLTSTALSVTLTATDSAYAIYAASIGLSVPAVSSAITFTPTSLLPATTGNAYSATIKASGGTAPYTYTVNNLPAWATATASTANDSVTIAGTPTSADIGTAAISIDAKDSTGLIGAQSYSLTTSAPGAGDPLLTGSYAFYGTGWQDGSTPSTTQEIGYIGSFTAGGKGVITNGEMDINGPTGLTSYTGIIGIYNVAANQTGTVTLELPSGQNLTLAVAMGGVNNTSGVAADGQFIEYDDLTGIGSSASTPGTRVSGSLALQSASTLSSKATPFTGSYAFGLQGRNPTAVVTSTCLTATSCGGLSVVGEITMGAAGVIASGEEDVTTGEKTAGSAPLTLGPGTLGNTGNTDASGRITANIPPPAATTNAPLNPPSNYVIYAVSPTEFYVMSSDSYATYSLYEGEAMQQNLPDIAAAPFTTSGTIVLYGTRVSGNIFNAQSTATGETRSEIYLLTVSSAGNFTGHQYYNGSGSINANSATTGTYSVGLSGRVAMVVASLNFTTYLVDTNEGFSMIASQAQGLYQIQPQTSTTLNAGTYVWGTPYPNSQIAPTEIGTMTVLQGGIPATATNVAVAGQAYASFAQAAYNESSPAGSLLFLSAPLTGSITNTSGLLTPITLTTGAAGTSVGIQGCKGTGGGYIVSPTEFVCVPGTDTYGEVHVFQQ